MQDNAYTQYINQIRDVLLNTLYARGDVANPGEIVNDCILLLERQWRELGLTPEVFSPFLQQFITSKATAASAGSAEGSSPTRRTTGRTTTGRIL